MSVTDIDLSIQGHLSDVPAAVEVDESLTSFMAWQNHEGLWGKDGEPLVRRVELTRAMIEQGLMHPHQTVPDSHQKLTDRELIDQLHARTTKDEAETLREWVKLGSTALTRSN